MGWMGREEGKGGMGGMRVNRRAVWQSVRVRCAVEVRSGTGSASEME